MAGRILSIEIGSHMTHLVEMDYKVKKPKIYQYFCVPTPENMIVDGSVTIVPIFVEGIRSELARRNVKTKKVVFVMNSTRIANREVEIPMVKEKLIHDLLITNSMEFFPVDLRQYQLVHKIVEKNEQTKKYKLSVLAVPNEMIASYTALAEALHLEIHALDYLGNSIAQGMLRLMESDVKVAIKIDETSSLLTIIQKEKVDLQRNIAYGISEAAEVVMDSKACEGNKSFATAIKVLREQCLIHSHLDEVGKNPLAEEVTESLRPLVGTIGRVLDYYASRNHTALEELWLFGDGAECQGLDELLTHELNMHVHVFHAIPDMIVNAARGSATEPFAMSEYVAAVAGTLSPLNFTLEKKSEKKMSKNNELFLPGLVCGACLAISVVLVGSSLISTAVLNSKNETLKRQLEELQEAEGIYQEYKLTEAEYANLQDMYQLTTTPNDALLTFLGEMEEKMPAEIVVEKMTAGLDGISMDMKVSSKTVAADVVVKLRDFTTVSDVTIFGITETFDDAGRNQVTFTISCQYANADMIDTEE